MSGAREHEPGRDPDLGPEMRAAEYVLGTLDARERAELEREAAADPAAARRVRSWEARLAPLMGGVPIVAPPPHVRAALLRAIPDRARPDQIAALRRRVRRWRAAAGGAGLLAAGLALFVALPSGLREGAGRGIGTAAGEQRYLAVVQPGGALPALIVRVDLRAGTAQVRPVGAETPAGRSLELWYIGAAGPQAIGLVGAAPSRIALPQGASGDGVIAVTVEPEGGAPDGRPTGPAVYTGKLIAE